MAKQDKNITVEGRITEALGYERFRVELDRSAFGRLQGKNGITITATPSGRIRQHHIRVIPGDRVEVEMSPYDLTHGRISYRKRQ